MAKLRVLCLGDVVADTGCEFIRERLWGIRKRGKIDAVIVNAENSAVGNGIDKTSSDMLFAAGADVLTTGNHVWRKKGTDALLESNESILRPANFPEPCAGNGYIIVDCMGWKILVVSLLGTVFMEALDSPFRTLDRILERERGNYDLCVVDFHAEATSEKRVMGFYLDGKVTAVVGTHTHVQTADEQILPKGTAYITDIGMTGPKNSVIGMDPEASIKRFVTSLPERYKLADGSCIFNGCIFEINDENCRVLKINRINLR